MSTVIVACAGDSLDRCELTEHPVAAVSTAIRKVIYRVQPRYWAIVDLPPRETYGPEGLIACMIVGIYKITADQVADQRQSNNSLQLAVNWLVDYYDTIILAGADMTKSKPGPTVKDLRIFVESRPDKEFISWSDGPINDFLPSSSCPARPCQPVA